MGRAAELMQVFGSPVSRKAGAWHARRQAGLRALALVVLLHAWLAQAQQRVFQFLRQEQGLENLSVVALLQDRPGNLWIGTENGLYSFDGARVRRYGRGQGLVEPRISALHLDQSGRLWVASDTRLFVREEDEFVEVRDGGEPISAQPGQALSSTRGRLVVNSRRGLYWVRREAAGWRAELLFDAETRRQHPEVRDVSSVVADPGGDVWFGCARSLCRFGTAGLHRYDPAGEALSEPLTSLLLTSDGRLWLRARTRLWRLDPGGEALQPMALPPAADVPAPWSPALVADRQQRILMQWGSGLARWDGRHWEQIAARQGLQTGGGVTALLQVRDGGVWLGTAGAGLAHWLGYEHLRHWGLAEGLPSDDVWSFLRSRAGELYIGTAGGLATEHGPLRGLQAPAPLRREVASSLAEDARGRLWVGSFNGALSRYDPITGTLTQLAKLPRITRLVTDRQGRLWIVTHDGIYLIDDPARDTPLHRIDQGLYPPKTQVPNAHDACLADDGRIWISTTTGLLRGEDGRLERLEVVDTTGQPLGEEWLRVIACGQGRLWMGGDHGLLELRIDGDSRTLRAQSLDVPLLHDRSVLSLHLDRRGWLWTGTDYGVAIWNMSRWRFIRQDAGLPWNDCNQGAVYEDRDGSMWLGTSRGAARFDDLDTLFAPPELSVHVGVQGRRLVRPDVRRGGADLTLPWQMRALVLDAASPAFEHRSALRFEYRMQGQDEDWRSGMAGELVYPSLQPGRYRFEVRVRNADLQAESPLQSLDIEVLPPWWRTDWFYALCATAAAALAWAAYRWRLHRVLARQRELRRLVAERTRQIEASHAQMRELALKDGLTGVLNRRALGDALAAEIARAGRSGKPLALVIVDADRFKQVNDRHGHLAGDAVLIAISQRLQAPTRPYDVVGRYGGEEFVLLLPDLDVDQPEGRARIDSFHRSISASAVKLDSGEELRVTCSFGVASLQPDRPESPNELIARADAALYRAKENGRNRVEYAPATPAP